MYKNGNGYLKIVAQTRDKSEKISHIAVPILKKII
jgi:hypothetical protein